MLRLHILIVCDVLGRYVKESSEYRSYCQMGLTIFRGIFYFREASLVFGMQPGSYNSESIMEFLSELHRHLGGDKVTLIWD